MSERVEEVIVGIDLGTTNSAIGVFRDGKPVVLKNSLGKLLTPSAVARSPRDGSLLVGRAAKDIIALVPSAGAAFFKRKMGREAKLRVGEEEMTPIELSGAVLGTLRAAAEKELGVSVERCVISVPAYFDEAQRVATRQAGELAGLKVERIINEPTAAAIAYGLHQSEIEQLFLVFDLGGGTLDVCVMELFEGSLEVRSSAGIADLGGEDFTGRLRQHVLKEVGLVGERAEMADSAAMALLYARCEIAKRALSSGESSRITVPAFTGLLQEPVEVVVSVESAEEAWASHFERMVKPIRSALRGAGIGPSAIERVILVGGATRMPAVRRVLHDFFDQEPLLEIDPDLAIVQGAVIQAALCADDAAVADIVVTDVASHSLGVDHARSLAGTFVPGYFAPIIHRNTALPTSRSSSFQTLYANQRVMEFRIYEGESRRVAENRLLGKLSVKGIPKGPPGREVAVTFTFDLNGILEVEARIAGTEKVFSTVLERSGRQLSAPEESAARERIAKLRSDPGEEPELQELLARADLLIQDLVGSERAMLESAISGLEEAIMVRTPSLIEQASELLREICDGLGGERW